MILYFQFALLVCAKPICNSSGWYLDPNHQISRAIASSACPKGYEIAIIKDRNEYNQVIELLKECYGPDRRVWIRHAFGVKGAGREQWMLAIPETRLRNDSQWSDLQTHNYHGQIEVNEIPKKQAPVLCKKAMFI